MEWIELGEKHRNGHTLLINHKIQSIYIYTVETRTFAFTYLQEQDSNLYPKLEKFSPDARNYNIQSVFWSIS